MVSSIVTATSLAALAWLVWLAGDLPRRIGGVRWIGIAAWVLLAAWLPLVIWYAPTEEAQGIIQKIFYVHIPAIIPTYGGFALCAIGGILFLKTRDSKWDALSLAGAEVGLVFCSLMLIVGPIWAKPAWGHWWVWDLRLTTTLILWFIYAAYLLLRALAFSSDAGRTFTAIYGILGTAAIGFVYKAVDIAKGSTLHPDNPAKLGLPPEMSQTVGVAMVAFVLVFAWLVARRTELAALEAEAESILAPELGLMTFVIAAYLVTAVVLVAYALRIRAQARRLRGELGRNPQSG